MFHEISMLHQEDNGNIILHQIISGETLSIQEVKPLHVDISTKIVLGLNNGTLEWAPYFDFDSGKGIELQIENGIIKIDASIDTRAIINDRLKDTNIYFLGDRVGLGRAPLHSYKFDIGIPENTLITAFHVGDGKFGFSMGNGTNQGFIPEIIGMGSDENDAGLYFIGRAGNDKPSTIPLIVFDGRNYLHSTVTNRPIFGVTNSQYDEYKFIIDQNGLVGIGKTPEIYKLEVNGKIRATDFILDSSISVKELIEIIITQHNEIDILKNRVTELEKS